ncbi:SusD/RagB family nutrient-binding outer membrane lipoprotein [Mangrovibacterium lignilyticum]|uniref:SusD/RagB family nutrient-binding outer membrane lipoprotein n=1 Tax=Mangrovibacterium lignilyticum TaxID=2668052 RepID=UPI0013D66452|nr:SusD/RagB family nutrient-binding outer membrane lipoprotein [Mangrovibacterium lignilyticum]
MKKFIYTISVFFLIGLVVSCDLNDKLEELNIDEKNPSEVPGEPLFTNGVRNMFDLMLETNVNRNVFRLYAQYWAQTTYPDESQYNQVTRNIPDNMWLILYRDVLKDLNGAKLIISPEETVTDEAAAIKANKLACIKIAEVYAYSTLVDIFGDIPYTDAMDATNASPTYDDAATVYAAVLDSLNAAISAIDVDYEGFSGQDPIYEGDMEGWLKAANSLKLRMALRLADTNSSTAESLAVAAAAGVIDSNDDNFTITYTSASPNTHPLWVDLVQSGRNDFVPANTLVDVMNDLSDPRRPIYFTDVDGAYDGGTYGSANAYSTYSHIGDLLLEPALPGTLISYAETEFLLAEAAARGYAVGGTAEEHYNAGIEASMGEWGVDDADVTTYLAEADVAYDASDWKQSIGVQKWLAMYNLPFEGWTAYRLLDFTGILQAPEDMTLSDIPVRFLYPIEEATLNGASYDAAAAAIGGDKKTTKLFWDAN